MDFLAKYDELQLPDEKLFGWYVFANLNDSGPNNHPLELIEDNSGISFAGELNINNDLLKIDTLGGLLNFTCIFSFSYSSSLISLAQIFASLDEFGRGWALCVDSNGRFFISVSSATMSKAQYFNCEASKSCVLVFQKCGSHFSLAVYDKDTGELGLFSSVAFPEINFPDGDLLLGGTPTIHISKFSSVFNTSAFTLHKLAVLDIFLPDFILNELCAEIITYNPDLQYRYRNVAVSNKGVVYTMDNYENNLFNETAIELQYSYLHNAFSLKGVSGINPSGVFYHNNSPEIPTDIFDKYVRFAPQSLSDKVILDNFNNNTIKLSQITFQDVTISGNSTKAATIISPERLHKSGVYVCDENRQHIYNKNINFSNISTLTEI